MTSTYEIGDYTVGWICAIPIELEAVKAVLDETHPQLNVGPGDKNFYQFGKIGKHNVVITCLPAGKYGITRAAVAATYMVSTFTRLRFGLMVGVGGGAPSSSNDIRLGDIVVSQPVGTSGGVIQYDFGKATENGIFQQTGSLRAPPDILLAAIAAMKATKPATLGRNIAEAVENIEEFEEDARFRYPGQRADRLFLSDYNHVVNEDAKKNTCKSCDSSKLIPRAARPHGFPVAHYGIIASGNQVVKDGVKRDKISAQTGAICFEMEAAGLMDDFPCLVIRGICDYSDGHKNKRWQPYAALVAALYAKQVLLQVSSVSNDGQSGKAAVATEVMERLNFIIPFQMPYPRNAAFVGRIEELRNAYAYLQGSTFVDTPSAYAITGTGGMGKTQIALEYAYRHNKDYNAVFWINATNKDTLCASLADMLQRIVDQQAKVTWPESTPDYGIIASKLGILGVLEKGVVNSRTENMVQIQKTLFDWLQLPGNRWLLVYDNADDLESFDLQSFLPKHGNGAIIITSRRPEFACTAEQVGLDGLDRENAEKLLLRFARQSDDGGGAVLVERLGFMPLAITQAGCYIRETKIPINEYLNSFETAFMDVQAKKPKFGWSYRNDTAATTWEISITAIGQEDELAVFILQVCSYLDPENISESLFESPERTKAKIKNSIILLSSYSLVKIIRFGVFLIHPVVHIWARERSDSALRGSFMRNAVTILGRASSQGGIQLHSQDWDYQEAKAVAHHLQCLHQMLDAQGWQLDTGDTSIDLYNFMHDIGEALSSQNKYNEALVWYHKSLAGKERLLDKNELPVLVTMSSIGATLVCLTRYEEAQKWHERELAIRTTLFGENNPSTLHIIHAIGIVLEYQGKY